jgi:hypothetical protein
MGIETGGKTAEMSGVIEQYMKLNGVADFEGHTELFYSMRDRMYNINDMTGVVISDLERDFLDLRDILGSQGLLDDLDKLNEALMSLGTADFNLEDIKNIIEGIGIQKDNNGLEKIKNLQHQLDLLKMPRADRERQLLIDQGISEEDVDDTLALKKKVNSETYIDDLQHQLDLLKMSKEERERQLLIDQGILETDVDEILALQKERDIEQLIFDLKESINDLMQTGVSSGLVDVFTTLGETIRDSTNLAENMSYVFRNMFKDMLSQMSSLLMIAGLKAIIDGNIPVGLALMAAGGASAFISGLIDDSKDQDQRKKELEELKRLQSQYIKLIEDQRAHEEYYLQKRRELNAFGSMNTTTVNDAIITPRGIVNTHPEDYIIATKHPERLTGGGGNVRVIINNNADNSTVTQTERQNGGIKEIIVSIDNLVKQNLANGNYNDALAQAQARTAGMRRWQ